MRFEFQTRDGMKAHMAWFSDGQIIVTIAIPGPVHPLRDIRVLCVDDVTGQPVEIETV